MTDYRLRNQEILYAMRPRQLSLVSKLLIVASIAVVLTSGVAAYLTDQFNPAATGFATASASPASSQDPTTTSSVTPAGRTPTRSGF